MNFSLLTAYAPNDRPVYTKMDDATFNHSYAADGRKLFSKVVTGFRKLEVLEPFADGQSDAPDGKGDLIVDPVFPVIPSIALPTEERYYIGPFELVKSYSDKMAGALMKPGLARINMTWGYIDSDGNKCEYIPDYQGNIRAVVRDGEVIQQTDYYPYGLPMATSTGATVSRYKYSGKEFDTRGGLNALDFHARQYAPATPLFDLTDPKSWDYPWLNPYLYCAANPIMNTDPTGMRVRVHDEKSKLAILNTLPNQSRTFVHFDQAGFISSDKLKEYKTSSFNYNSLFEMVENETTVNVISNDSFTYTDDNGDIHTKEMGDIDFDDFFKEENPESPTNPTTGEEGFYGTTLMPGQGITGQNSPDDEVHIVLNSNLSPLGAAQTFSHEGYGHGYMYITTKDRSKAAHDFREGCRDVNSALINRIIKSILETIDNFQNTE